MAIKKYVGDHYYNLTNFYNWLNENKSGTFLENMTITLVTGSDTGSEITIESENAALTYKTIYSSSGNVVSLHGLYNDWVQYYAGASGNTGSRFNSVLLCTNGIIFAVDSYSSNGGFPTNYFIVTVDSNGEIAFISTEGNINVTSPTGYRVAAYDSTTTPTVTLTPEYNSMLTSLAPVVPTTGDNSITLPYAFAAVHTQFANRGLSEVAIGGNNYITNGNWYIKD